MTAMFKFTRFVLLFLMAGGACAQSSLPPCPTNGYRHNCFGSITYANGNKYVGEFKDGRYSGQGTYFEIGGGGYAGEYKYGKSDGKGYHTFTNGYKFSGDFKQGNMHGLGIMYSDGGEVILQGRWENHKLVKSINLDLNEYPFRKLSPTLANGAQTTVTQNNRPVINVPSERRVALLIGNATYKVNPLKNPVNDSNDMARSLRSVGFDVIEVNNATLVQMREATRKFADKLSNSDVGLVYYSGHGVEVSGKNYLIPVNADIKREYEVVDQAFDASQFLEMMDNIRGPNNKRVNILIVDACRNNELQRSLRSTTNGLARMDAPGGTFISFATAPGRVAADGVGRNSPYTKHLLQALKQPNMPIEQVFKVVRRNVMDETMGEQIPWENSSLVGDFFFTVQK